MLTAGRHAVYSKRVLGLRQGGSKFLKKSDRAAALKADEGMLDVGELRIHLQRGDQPALLKVLDRIRRDHTVRITGFKCGDASVCGAGIDLGAMAAAGGGAPAGPGGSSSPAGPAAAPAAEPGKLWTPGSKPSGGGDEKPAIWTP